MKRAAIYLGLIALVSGSALALAGAEPGPEPGPEPGISYKLLHRYPHDRTRARARDQLQAASSIST